MTLPDRPRYGIRSKHPKVVTDGTRVTYELVRLNISMAEIDPPANGGGNPIFRIFPSGHPYHDTMVVHPRVRWRLESDPNAVANSADTITDGPEGTEYTWTLTLDDVGDHLITCEVLVPAPWASQDDEFDVAERVQQVTFSAVRIAEIEHRFHELGFDGFWAEFAHTRINVRPRKLDKPVRDFDDYVIRPEEFLARVERLTGLQEHIESQAASASAANRADTAEQLKKQRAYCEALRKVTWRDHSTSRSRIPVTHFVREAGAEVERFVYISMHTTRRVTGFAEVGDKDSPTGADDVLLYHVSIVDWTDPLARGGAGIWRGTSAEPFAAIDSALSHWRTGNRYPAGTVVFDLPGWVDVEFISADRGLPHRFETSGATFIEELTTWMDGASLVVGLAALVGLLFAPVATPAVGMIWAALAGSSGAAAIRLVDRRFDDNLAANPIEDALDLLTIASNLAAVPGMSALWRRGAQVILPVTTLDSSRVLRMVFVGQVVADGAQGVLIAVDSHKKIETLLADTSLPADERARQMLTLLASLAMTAAVIAVSIRGNIFEINGLDDTLLRHRDKLIEPDGTLDLTTPNRAGGNADDDVDFHIEVDVDPPNSTPPVDPFPRLSTANEALARAGDDSQKAALTRMLDVDSAAVDLLLTQYRLAVADHADAFIAVWARTTDLRIPPSMVRVYHEHTGLTGIDYLAGLHLDKPAITDNEVWAAMWASTMDDTYRNERNFAGHSVARHGAHATDVQLTRRISTGVAPDEVTAHTRTSTRFLTYVQWLTAHDVAFAAFRREFKAAEVDIDIDLPRDDAGVAHCKVVGVFDVGEVLARGFDATGPGVGPSGQKTWATNRELAASELDQGKVQVKFGWTGSQWIPIQIFGVPNTKESVWFTSGAGSAI